MCPGTASGSPAPEYGGRAACGWRAASYKRRMAALMVVGLVEPRDTTSCVSVSLDNVTSAVPADGATHPGNNDCRRPCRSRKEIVTDIGSRWASMLGSRVRRADSVRVPGEK